MSGTDCSTGDLFSGGLEQNKRRMSILSAVPVKSLCGYAISNKPVSKYITECVKGTLVKAEQ